MERLGGLFGMLLIAAIDMDMDDDGHQTGVFG